MGSMRIILTFYRNFSWVVLSITFFGCSLIVMSGTWNFVVSIFWMKLFTNAMLGLFIHIFSPEQLYFFNNLGYSKTRIFASAFLLDMVIWFLLSWLTIKIFL